MSIYYIDFSGGKPENDGLSPANARNDYKDLDVRPGDTVLFKRGNFIREMLKTVAGEEGKRVTYSAYGEGDAPVFCGSVDASKPEDWAPVRENIWRLTIPGVCNVGNLVFNGEECTATLRWVEEDLSEQGDFFDPEYGKNDGTGAKLLLYSVGNPASVYRNIEVVPYGRRRMATLVPHLVLDGLTFINSGVHGTAGGGEDIIIRNCTYRRIGGCVWSYPLRIRFGNAIELWEKGNDVLVENCDIRDVYDSCVTQQGSAAVIPAHRFVCRNCTFDTYGMAAYEYRDRMQIDGVFENNICRNAGCGFAMRGEVLPRRSEIWPQPMGHHIFLWRIDHPTEGGHLEIRNNIFGAAPVGAAIYSIICPEAEAQMVVDGNTYTESNPALFVRFAGTDFVDFASYRKATGNDKESKLN